MELCLRSFFQYFLQILFMLQHWSEAHYPFLSLKMHWCGVLKQKFQADHLAMFSVTYRELRHISLLLETSSARWNYYSQTHWLNKNIHWDVLLLCLEHREWVTVSYTFTLSQQKGVSKVGCQLSSWFSVQGFLILFLFFLIIGVSKCDLQVSGILEPLCSCH